MFIDEANHIYIAMPMHNLIEYNVNYTDTSGSLWQFKRDEVPVNNADLTIDNSQSFKYKAALVGKTTNTVNNTNSSVKNAKNSCSTEVLEYFWRLLKMLLINIKIHLELNWIEDCILSSDGNSAKFKIRDIKLLVPIVALSAKDNVSLTKQLGDGFKSGEVKHEVRVTSSNPRFTSSNPRVTSSSPQVVSSNLRVRKLKARV